MTNKEAIFVLKKEFEYIPSDYDKSALEKALELAIKALEERPQGEWIDYDNTFYKCPDCGYLLEKCCPQCQNKVILPKGGAENV